MKEQLTDEILQGAVGGGVVGGNAIGKYLEVTWRVDSANKGTFKGHVDKLGRYEGDPMAYFFSDITVIDGSTPPNPMPRLNMVSFIIL